MGDEILHARWIAVERGDRRHHHGPHLGHRDHIAQVREMQRRFAGKQNQPATLLELHIGRPGEEVIVLDPAYDGLEYSVMSYRSYLGGPTSYYTVEAWGYPQSLMMLDIAAIQQIYGADFTTEAGDTTYRFDPTTGELTVNGVSAGIPGANRVFRTIWDGNGTDTLDLSAYSTNLRIDLNPGMGTDLNVTGFAQRAKLGTDSTGATIYAANHIYIINF